MHANDRENDSPPNAVEIRGVLFNTTAARDAALDGTCIKVEYFDSDVAVDIADLLPSSSHDDNSRSEGVKVEAVNDEDNDDPAPPDDGRSIYGVASLHANRVQVLP